MIYSNKENSEGRGGSEIEHNRRATDKPVEHNRRATDKPVEHNRRATDHLIKPYKSQKEVNNWGLGVAISLSGIAVIAHNIDNLKTIYSIIAMALTSIGVGMMKHEDGKNINKTLFEGNVTWICANITIMVIIRRINIGMIITLVMAIITLNHQLKKRRAEYGNTKEG